MPPWLLPILKNLVGGLFSFITGEKVRADRERAEGLAAERESIRRAAAAERRISSAVSAGVEIKSPDDWNKIAEEWDW